MSGDLTELLARTAPSPQQPLDLDAVLHRSRQRTRRRRGGLAAGTAAVLAAAVVAWPGGLPGPVVDDTPIVAAPTEGDADEVTADMLAGTVWELVELPDGEPSPPRLTDPDLPHLLTFGRQGMVEFHMSCIEVEASYELTDGQLQLDDALAAVRPCAEGTDELREAIASVLFGSPHVSMDGDRLDLRAETGRLVYEAVGRATSSDDATVDPALMVVGPASVAPGDTVEVRFPEGTTRGPGFVIERAEADGWVPVQMVHSDTEGTTSPNVWTAEEFAELGVVWDAGPAIDDTRPHQLPILEDLDPGEHRVCTTIDPETLCAVFEIR